MANFERDGAKERFWRDVLERHAASGLDVRAFCRRDGLSEASFYAWRRTIGQRDAEPSRPVKRRWRSPKFLPVRVADPALHAAAIVIELVGGPVLRLPESISTERLVELVTALEARGAK